MPANEEIRLQKFMAMCGVASRRSCEEIILSGRVSVNGQTVTELGTKVTLSDTVQLDGAKLSLESQKRYVLLNKPEGCLCSMSDDRGRPLAVDLLKEKYPERLYNVGRLDMFSTGLVIFTNDGDFARKLSHPSAQLEKEYIVETSIPLPRNLAASFEKGLRVDGVFYRCKEATELNSHKIKIVLIEGKNREIRRVFESMNVGIKRLTRVRIGCISISSPDLKKGQSRNLTSSEVSALLNLCQNN